jgi:two-component system, LytTR family, sensor kinase
MLSLMPKPKEVLLFSISGSLLLTLVPIFMAFDQFRESGSWLRLSDAAILFVLVVIMFYLALVFNVRWHKKKAGNKILLNLALLVILSAASIAIHSPIWKLTSHFPVSFYIRDELVRNFTLILASFLATQFIAKMIETRQIQNALVRVQNEQLTSQVASLTQQINPHFLFNSLNTLSGLVQESPEKSEVFINRLSLVFRYVLQMQERNSVTLEEELKFAADYLYLLKMRFEDKLSVEINIQDHGKLQVPTLCSQLLIENVIKHNRMTRQSPVHIEIFARDNYLIISNNMLPMNVQSGFGLGLKNLNKRSELLSGKPIIISQSEGRFEVKVPLMKR